MDLRRAAWTYVLPAALVALGLAARARLARVPLDPADVRLALAACAVAGLGLLAALKPTRTRRALGTYAVLALLAAPYVAGTPWGGDLGVIAEGVPAPPGGESAGPPFVGGGWPAPYPLQASAIRLYPPDADPGALANATRDLMLADGWSGDPPRVHWQTGLVFEMRRAGYEAEVRVAHGSRDARLAPDGDPAAPVRLQVRVREAQ